jgi:RNA polymerase sigma-70 factor (ECF subfamily)
MTANVDPIEALFGPFGSMLAIEVGGLGAREPVQQDPRVEAAVNGDRRAAEKLLAELLPRVRNLVRYLCRGDGDVDDIAQDALIAIYKSFPSYRGEGKLASWADKVTARVTIKAIQKRKRHRAHVTEMPDLVPVASDGPGPDALLFQRRFVRLLDELPEKQRTTMVLHHAVGMSVPEAAEMMEVPIETVRSRLRLGTSKLRELLAAREEQGHG